MARVYRVDILEEELRRLAERVPGLKGVVIVSIEGFVVAAHEPGEANGRGLGANTPQVAAMAATLIALGEQTLKRLAQGQVERLMVEGEDGAIIVYPIDENAAIAAMVAKDAKMGLAFIGVSRAANRFRRLLGSAAE
jgi:predicted regulator of Ras-like GTPase activity (Roadblock/LC7/MglB family)